MPLKLVVERKVMVYLFIVIFCFKVFFLGNLFDSLLGLSSVS